MLCLQFLSRARLLLAGRQQQGVRGEGRVCCVGLLPYALAPCMSHLRVFTGLPAAMPWPIIINPRSAVCAASYRIKRRTPALAAWPGNRACRRLAADAWAGGAASRHTMPAGRRRAPAARYSRRCSRDPTTSSGVMPVRPSAYACSLRHRTSPRAKASGLRPHMRV
jgi:hypothetical protein